MDTSGVCSQLFLITVQHNWSEGKYLSSNFANEFAKIENKNYDYGHCLVCHSNTKEHDYLGKMTIYISKNGK